MYILVPLLWHKMCYKIHIIYVYLVLCLATYTVYSRVLSLYFAVAIVTLVSMECTENSSVELLVDGKQLNSTTLPHPSNEHLIVECRCTSGNGLPEWFFPNGTAIPSCHDITKLQICTQTNETTDSVNLNLYI